MSNSVGANIKRIRIMRGMTQKELSDAIGYTDRSMIAKIETGKTDIYQSMILKIADVLRVNPILLFDFYDDSVEEFLPYLSKADPTTLNNIRAILGMPTKKI